MPLIRLRLDGNCTWIFICSDWVDSLPANTFLPFNCSALPYVASRCGVFLRVAACFFMSSLLLPGPACIPLCVAEVSACTHRYSLALMLRCLLASFAASLLLHILRNPKRRKIYLLSEWLFRFSVDLICVKLKHVAFRGISHTLLHQ